MATAKARKNGNGTTRALGNIFVTGASRGIGGATARWLATRGAKVYAGVRRSEDAPALDGIEPIELDLGSDEQILRAVEQVRERVGDGGLDGLVNNAAISVLGPLEHLPIDRVRELFDINVIAQLRVTQLCLPLLRRGRGKVIFLGGLLGHSSLPFSGAQCATKFAVEALADALRLELASSGVEVVVIDPGPVSTEAASAAVRDLDRLVATMSDEGRRIYARPIEAMRMEREQSRDQIMPEEVARVVARALEAERPRARYFVGAYANASRFLETMPVRVRDWVVRRMVMGRDRAEMLTAGKS